MDGESSERTEEDDVTDVGRGSRIRDREAVMRLMETSR